MSHDASPPRPARTRLQRWLLATLGVVSVGVGAVGVVLPGLPTTIFLLIASWCFARSCPWLEDRLIRVPLFRPFLGSLGAGARMPLRAVVTTLAVMWLAVSASAALLGLGDPPRPALAAFIVALGLVGSFFVLRLRERAPSTAARPLERRDAGSPAPAD
jgi:uncharacterized protein